MNRKNQDFVKKSLALDERNKEFKAEQDRVEKLEKDIVYLKREISELKLRIEKLLATLEEKHNEICHCNDELNCKNDHIGQLKDDITKL